MDNPVKFKKVSETLNRINQLNERKELQIIYPNSSLNNQKIEIWKSGNNFEFLLNAISSDFGSAYSSIFDSCKLVGKTKVYSFLKDSLVYTSIGERIVGKLTSIIESDANPVIASYFRIVQPLTKNAEICFLEESIDLQTDAKSSYLCGLNRMTINSEEVEAFRLEIEEKKFLIIDSCSFIDFERFRDITDSFFAAYAFVFGKTVGEETYFLSSSDNNFENISQIIFFTKPASFVEEYPIFNNRFQSKLQLFPKNIFETICNNYLSKEQFPRTLKILNEAFLSSFELSKCILYATALETIASLILDKELEPKHPVNQQNLKKSKLIQKLRRLVNEQELLTKDEKHFLNEKKINSLNTPTNFDKTREAFKMYGIKLPNELEKTLDYRNYYLHGSIPKGDQFGFKIDNLIRAYEMQFLVSILILKLSGYSGRVQNKSAAIEYHAHMKNNSSDNIKLKQSIFYKI